MKRNLLTALILVVCAGLGFLLFRGENGEEEPEAPPAEPEQPLPLSGAAQRAQWPAFQRGGELHGKTAGLPGARMKVRWTFKTGAGGGEFSAAIADGIVYIGDRAGNLRALDLTSGERRWIYQGKHPIAATPLVADGRVLIGDEYGIFHAVSAQTGKKLWTFKTGDSIHASGNIAGERVLFGSYDQHAYCLRMTDGKLLWRYRLGRDSDAGDEQGQRQYAQVHATPAISKGVVYVAGCDMVLHAVDLESGRPRWRAEANAIIATAPLVVEDTVLFGTMEERVYCLSVEDGRELWQWQKQDAVFYAAPAFADGLVVFPGRNGDAWCLHAVTGQEQWHVPSRSGFEGAPAIAGAAVLLPGGDGRLHAIDLEAGRPLWSFAAGARIHSSPAVGEGAVVFADYAGTVFCLEPAAQ